MKRLIIALTALALSACGDRPPVLVTTPAPVTEPITRAEVIDKVAVAAADVADALKVAPPATLTATTIDERALRKAQLSYEIALYGIDGLVATGALKRGTPPALTVKRLVDLTLVFLETASAAQSAGSAKTYREALANARDAYTALQTALKK